MKNKYNSKGKEKRLKVAKIIIFIVTLTMVAGTVAMSFSFGGKSNEKEQVETKNVTEKNLNKNGKVEDVNVNVTPELKKNIENVKVQAKGNEVAGVVIISNKINKIQADKTAEACMKNLQEKYKGKNINIKVVYKNQTASELSAYQSVPSSKNKNIPQAEVQICSGITMMDRYVSITLKTDKPQQYTVEIAGKKLEYVPKKKYFDGLIESSDEAKIRKSLKITPIVTKK